MNNAEKTIKNSFISVIAQVITLLLQFVNRRVFIIFLDIEFLGYQTLFSNVFSLLSVAELGIGNIIAFQLYEEIVNENTEEIGKLMYLFKQLYRFVAVIVLVAGIGCSFLLPTFVKDATASWSYLTLIYYLQLASVVTGYFLSYKRTIFIATQQEYKCVQIDLYTNAVIQVVQLALLAVFHNYIVYLCLQLSTNLLSNLWISYKANKEYPYLNKKYSITKEEISKRNLFQEIKNFLVHQICYIIYGGTDNIIISAFCGVRTVALYGNYVVVQKGVMQLFFYKLLNPVQATLGNIIYGERRKEDLWKQFQMLDVFSFYFATYIGLGFWIFYQPFIQVWLGKEYLLDNLFVAIFSATIYLGAVFEIVYKYRTAFGDFAQDRNFMLISAFLNVLISIPGAKLIGVEGVQIGTFIAFIPIALGRIRFVVKNYFGQSLMKYLVKHTALFCVAILEGGICYLLLNHAEVSVEGFILRGFVWFIVPTLINTIIYCRSPHFLQLLIQIKKIVSIVLRNRGGAN